MNRLKSKRTGLKLRKQRIQSRVKGTAGRPRLSIFISNKHISAQIIDDTSSKTLVAVNTSANKNLKGSMKEKAKWVGEEIAKVAKSKKISRVSLDRNGRLYHGRIRELAQAAREKGLEF